MIRKDFCDNYEAPKLDSTYEKFISIFYHLEFIDIDNFKEELLLSENYKRLCDELSKIENIKIFVAHKYSPIKFMLNDEIIALVMPMQKQLTPQQENILMVNNFKEYAQYKDLIPIEFKFLVMKV